MSSPACYYTQHEAEPKNNVSLNLEIHSELLCNYVQKYQKHTKL